MDFCCTLLLVVQFVRQMQQKFRLHQYSSKYFEAKAWEFYKTFSKKKNFLENLIFSKNPTPHFSHTCGPRVPRIPKWSTAAANNTKSRPTPLHQTSAHYIFGESNMLNAHGPYMPMPTPLTTWYWYYNYNYLYIIALCTYIICKSTKIF